MPVQSKSDCVLHIEKACETHTPTVTGGDFCKRWSLKQSCKPCLCPTAKCGSLPAFQERRVAFAKEGQTEVLADTSPKTPQSEAPAHMSRWCEYLQELNLDRKTPKYIPILLTFALAMKR